MAKGISPPWRFAAAGDRPVALFLDVEPLAGLPHQRLRTPL